MHARLQLMRFLEGLFLDSQVPSCSSVQKKIPAFNSFLHVMKRYEYDLATLDDLTVAQHIRSRCKHVDTMLLQRVKKRKSVTDSLSKQTPTVNIPVADVSFEPRQAEPYRLSRGALPAERRASLSRDGKG